MGENSNIEWTDHTFNPWVGCTKVSPACDNCYAESWAKRAGTPELWTGGARRRTTPANWRKPLRWNARAAKLGVRYRVFCASLADVFDNTVPVEWRADLFDLIDSTPHLDWLLLTKRVGNARSMIPDRWSVRLPDNVWLGITVVTQAEADRDIPKLLALHARVRFLSMEPLLEPVRFRDYTLAARPCFVCKTEDELGEPRGTNSHPINCAWRNAEERAGRAHHPGDYSRGGCLDWVIVGGESGPRARPLEEAWALDLARQCREAGTAFFMKQGSEANWPNWKEPARWPAELRLRESPRLSDLGYP